MPATTRTNKARQKARQGAKVCIRCNRVLSAEVEHVVTVLGIVGPECEQYVVNVLAQLARNGLRELAETGELWVPAVRSLTGGWTACPVAFEARNALAQRMGLELAPSLFDPESQKVRVVLTRASVRELLRRAQETKGVLA